MTKQSWRLDPIGGTGRLAWLYLIPHHRRLARTRRRHSFHAPNRVDVGRGYMRARIPVTAKGTYGDGPEEFGCWSAEISKKGWRQDGFIGLHSEAGQQESGRVRLCGHLQGSVVELVARFRQSRLGDEPITGRLFVTVRFY